MSCERNRSYTRLGRRQSSPPCQLAILLAPSMAWSSPLVFKVAEAEQAAVKLAPPAAAWVFFHAWAIWRNLDDVGLASLSSSAKTISQSITTVRERPMHEEEKTRTFHHLAGLLVYTTALGDNGEHTPHLLQVLFSAPRFFEGLPSLQESSSLSNGCELALRNMNSEFTDLVLQPLILESAVAPFEYHSSNNEIPLDHINVLILFLFHTPLRPWKRYRVCFEHGERYPDLDVASELSKPLVQVPDALSFAFSGLKVDVGFPEDLGHRKRRL